jgi:hypothetical protein
MAIAGACLIFCNGCAAAESKGEVVVGANHAHSADILTVTVIGRVPDNGKKIGVTAKFSETENRLEGLSIVTPDGKSIAVPSSYFEKVRLPQPRSLSLGYIMEGDSKTVGGILVFLDFGDLRRSADLKCANDLGDPLFESYSLFYDTKARTFATTFKDYCGEPLAAQ